MFLLGSVNGTFSAVLQHSEFQSLCFGVHIFQESGISSATNSPFCLSPVVFCHIVASLLFTVAILLFPPGFFFSYLLLTFYLFNFPQKHANNQITTTSLVNIDLKGFENCIHLMSEMDHLSYLPFTFRTVFNQLT